MTNIKSNVSDVNLNYSAKRNYSFGSNIIADVSDETVANTTKMEAESVDLSNVTEMQESLSSEELKTSLELQRELLDFLIDDYNKQYQQLQDEYRDYYHVSPVREEEIKEEMSILKQQIVKEEEDRRQINHQIELLPYEELKNTDDYNDFISNYDVNYQNINFQLFADCGYDPEQYSMKLYGSDYKNHGVDPLAIAENYVNANKDNENFDIEKYIQEFDKLNINLGDKRINAFDFYMYSTEEQQQIYHYIFATQGEEQANEYLSKILDDINSNKGLIEASKFIDSLEKYKDDPNDPNSEEKIKESIDNFLKIGYRGAGDGVDVFFDGIEHLINENATLSADEYARMYVLQYLSSQDELNQSQFYNYGYQFTNAFGNLLPSMLASAIVSIAATPAAGSIVGSALMGLSAGGNAYHQARVDGADALLASLYGILIGTSEAALEKFLGGIPGISNEAGFTLSALLREGGEEALQEYIDAGFRAALFGENIDLSAIEENARDSFILGVLMAGFTNGGQKAIEVTIDGVKKIINIEKVLKYKKEHPNTSLEEIIKNENEIEIDFSKLYDENPNAVANILKERGFSDEEIVQMLNDLSKEEIIEVLQENLHQSDVDSDIFKINYGDISNITSEQFNNQLNDIKKNYPEYENELNEIQSKMRKNNEITDEMIDDVSKIWEKILTSNNYDPKFTKKGYYARKFEEISNLRKFEMQSDGSYTYYAYENDTRYDFDDIKDVVKYAMKNDLSLKSNSDEVLGVLDKQIEDYKKELSNHKINNFYGNKEFINENTDYINKAYNSLCETKYITEQEKLEVLKYQKNIENLTKEINDLSKESKISKDDYIKLSDKYQQLLEIEKELSKINEKAWNRYFEETGATYVHCYSKNAVSPSEFPAKICTSLLAADDGSIISNWGVEFRPDFDSIDTISPMDADSWDYDSEYDFINKCVKSNGYQSQFSDSMIHYGGGEHSKLFSPEYIEKSIPTNKETYTEIVLKDGTVKPYKYFITENATPEQLARIKVLAKKDGVEVEVINSKTYERIPLEVYEAKYK